MYKLFGIKNCGSVKKAIDWLDNHNISYEFHDYKKLGIDTATLQEWVSQKGWQNLINKAGTTFKKLPIEVQQSIENADAAIALMQSNTSCIKRPIITDEKGKIQTIRFDESVFNATYL